MNPVDQTILADHCLADALPSADTIKTWTLDDYTIESYSIGLRVHCFGGMMPMPEPGVEKWRDADPAMAAYLHRWGITEDSVDLMEIARHVLTTAAAS